MRCKETRKREKHTAPSNEKKIIKKVKSKKWFSNLSRKDSKRKNSCKSDFRNFGEKIRKEIIHIKVIFAIIA